MLSNMFSLFGYWATQLLDASWFQILAVATCFVGVVRLFWYLAGVET